MTTTSHFQDRDPNKERSITPHLYKTRAGAWFVSKRAVALRDLTGSNGELICAGETVIIKRKWAGFIVVSGSGACAWRVAPEDLALI